MLLLLQETVKCCNNKLRHDSTWMQHVTNLQPSTSSAHSFKSRIIDVGESSSANRGIKIGLAYKLESSIPSSHKEKELVCYYNCQNGGIYHNSLRPIEFVERGKPDDVVEWFISSSNTEEGQVLNLVVLKINGERKGTPLNIKRDTGLYPTLHISSSGAKLKVGNHDVKYPEYEKGKSENLFSL